jgi:hypothetical protein
MTSHDGAALAGHLARREDLVPQGGNWAWAAGLIAVLLGMALVFFFPEKDREAVLVAGYHERDSRPPQPVPDAAKS